MRICFDFIDNEFLSIHFADGPLGGIRLDINVTDIEVIEGDDVQNISCVAECKPNCTIYWTRVPDFEHKGGELMLTNISKENTGEYICHARNDYGSANTSFALRVYRTYTRKLIQYKRQF